MIPAQRAFEELLVHVPSHRPIPRPAGAPAAGICPPAWAMPAWEVAETGATGRSRSAAGTAIPIPFPHSSTGRRCADSLGSFARTVERGAYAGRLFPAALFAALYAALLEVT